MASSDGVAERQQALLSAMGASADAVTVQAIPRYLRLRTGCSSSTIDRDLAALGHPPAALTPLENFIALDSKVPVTTLSCHGPRLALGMDLASGVVVRELLRGASRTAHVLDVCCAPGAKLLYAAELCGSVTGVDISQSRIEQCKAHVRRLALTNVRLVAADATEWLPAPPPENGPWGGVHPSCWNARKLAQTEARAARAEARGEAAESEALRAARLQACEAEERPWERVMVDAECSADGSLPHLRRMLALQESVAWVWDRCGIGVG